jgi:hypothetical protein
MSDMTNEPTGTGPDDVTPIEPAVAPTEPIPVAGYPTPATDYAVSAEPVYAAVPPAEAAAGGVPPAPAASHVSISKRWLWIGGGIVLGVILLGTTFAAGAAVGGHGGRFEGRGRGMMGQQAPGGGYGMPGGQGQFRGDGQGYHQRGGMRGWGGEQGQQQQGVPQQLPGVPNTQQNPSTAPTQ